MMGEEQCYCINSARSGQVVSCHIVTMNDKVLIGFLSQLL